MLKDISFNQVVRSTFHLWRTFTQRGRATSRHSLPESVFGAMKISDARRTGNPARVHSTEEDGDEEEKEEERRDG